MRGLEAVLGLLRDGLDVHAARGDSGLGLYLKLLGGLANVPVRDILLVTADERDSIEEAGSYILGRPCCVVPQGLLLLRGQLAGTVNGVPRFASCT